MEYDTPKNSLTHWLDRYEQYSVEERGLAWDYINKKHNGIWDKAVDDLKAHPNQYEVVFDMFCFWIEEYRADKRVELFIASTP